MSKLYRTMIALFVAAAALIGISGIPALKNADHGWKWILGGIGWFGGLLLALAVIVLALYALARVAASRRRANAT
jgi:flagellar biogenesis protein FliO